MWQRLFVWLVHFAFGGIFLLFPKQACTQTTISALKQVDRHKPRSKVVVDVRVHKTFRYNTTWDNHKFLSTWDSQHSQVLLTLARVSNVALYFRGKLSRFIGVGSLINSVHGSPFCFGGKTWKKTMKKPLNNPINWKHFLKQINRMIVVIISTRKLHQCVKNLEALRPEVGISPGAKELASSSDVELKKELYRARVGIGNSDCGF